LQLAPATRSQSDVDAFVSHAVMRVWSFADLGSKLLAFERSDALAIAALISVVAPS